VTCNICVAILNTTQSIQNKYAHIRSSKTHTLSLSTGGHNKRIICRVSCPISIPFPEHNILIKYITLSHVLHGYRILIYTITSHHPSSKPEYYIHQWGRGCVISCVNMLKYNIVLWLMWPSATVVHWYSR